MRGQCVYAAGFDKWDRKFMYALFALLEADSR